MKIPYDHLCGPQREDLLPWLDQHQVRDFIQWRNEGVVIKPGFIPEPLMQAYEAVRDPLGDRPWGYPTPYMEHAVLKDICLFPDLNRLLHNLIGHPMGLHLCLTDYKSTERRWHMDRYLNPEHVNDHYVAVWMALEDISPDSGPFQYIRGSHRNWPKMTRQALFESTPKELHDPRAWPSLTQDIVGDAVEREIEHRNEIITTYLPKRGDLLVWHSALIHRGSKPTNPTASRKALIAHYSSIHHRPDMPAAKPHGTGWFFPITTLGKS